MAHSFLQLTRFFKAFVSSARYVRFTSFANAAFSTIFAVIAICQIFAAKRMPFRAMRLLGIKTRKSIAAHCIDKLCDYFNMCRIYAMANAAKMVAFKIGVGRFYKQSVKQSMCEKASQFMNMELAITRFFINKSRPFPTRNAFVKIGFGYLDFGKQSRKNCAVYGNFGIFISRHFDLRYRLNCLGSASVDALV